MLKLRRTGGITRKKRKGIFYLLIFIISVFSFVGAEVNGYLKGLAYIDPHTKSYDRLGTRFQTRFTGGIGSKLEYFAAFDYDYDLTEALDSTGYNRINGFGVYPVEYFLDLRLSALDIRFGQQFIFWGVTSWVNPVDVINPWDYGNMSGEIEDYRLPVLALNAQWYLPVLTVQGVVIPGFTTTVMDMPNSITVQYPDMAPDNPQLGLRATSYGGNLDLSFSVFKGYDQLPSVAVFIDHTTIPPIVETIALYHPYTLLGVDFVRTVNAWNIKGTAAYRKSADGSGHDIFVTNSNLQTVLGVDYIWSDDLSLNLQYNSQYLLDYNYDSEVASIQIMDVSDYLSADEQYTHSLSTLISWSPFNYVTSQIVGLYNLKDRDSFVMAFLNWELADASNLTAGMVLFAGAEGTTYGRMAKAEKIFIELKRSF